MTDIRPAHTDSIRRLAAEQHARNAALLAATPTLRSEVRSEVLPLALDLATRDGRIKAGQKVLLEGVGGGFTWGAALVEM